MHVFTIFLFTKPSSHWYILYFFFYFPKERVREREIKKKRNIYINLQYIHSIYLLHLYVLCLDLCVDVCVYIFIYISLNICNIYVHGMDMWRRKINKWCVKFNIYQDNLIQFVIVQKKKRRRYIYILSYLYSTQYNVLYQVLHIVYSLYIYIYMYKRIRQNDPLWSDYLSIEISIIW